MAFEEKFFPDGDSVFSVPQWRRDLSDIQQQLGAIDFSAKDQESRSFQENELGLKHPENGSFIRIRDDGAIEAFSKEGNGFRISPNGSLQLFGDRMQVVSREVDFLSRENGTNLNGEVLGKNRYSSYPYRKGMDASTRSLLVNNQEKKELTES